MTPVQVDWLTLLLGPLTIVALVIAFAAHRSARKSGDPMPGWGKAAQRVGISGALGMAFIQMLWGGA